jgi:Rieske Fe-S protein
VAAAYRDRDGELHLLSPRCRHFGCTVAWNDLDKTWDCPCHGGRYRATGEPLYGPPVAPLERLEQPAWKEPDAPIGAVSRPEGALAAED